MSPKFWEVSFKLLCLCLSATAAIASFLTLLLRPGEPILDVISFAFGIANTAMAIWMAKEAIKAWRRK